MTSMQRASRGGIPCPCPSFPKLLLQLLRAYACAAMQVATHNTLEIHNATHTAHFNTQHTPNTHLNTET